MNDTVHNSYHIQGMRSCCECECSGMTSWRKESLEWAFKDEKLFQAGGPSRAKVQKDFVKVQGTGERTSFVQGSSGCLIQKDYLDLDIGKP